MPIGEFAGGQIYKAGGYAIVYIASLFVCTCGIIYVMIVIPDELGNSVSKCDGLSRENVIPQVIKEAQKEGIETHDKNMNCIDTIVHSFRLGNKSIFESYRYNLHILQQQSTISYCI